MSYLSRNAARFVAIISARGGSKGIPRKNLTSLNNKPLISYTLEAAEKSHLIDRIIVSTDSREIANYCKQWKVDVPFLRPKSLAQDDTTVVAVVQHALQWLKTKEGFLPNSVVLLQPTSPLRTTSSIDMAIEEFLRQRADTLVGVCSPKTHPYRFVFFKDGTMRFFVKRPLKSLNRQEYPQAFFINGAIYIAKTENVFRGRLYGRKVVPFEMNYGESLDVDEQEDLQLAEFYLKNRNSKGKKCQN